MNYNLDVSFSVTNMISYGLNSVRHYTNTSAIYDLSVDETGSNYGIVFSISNNQLNQTIQRMVQIILYFEVDICRRGTSGVGDATFTVPNNGSNILFLIKL